MTSPKLPVHGRVMVQSARQRLDEAEYFYERMKELKGEPEFQYVLNAFLSAGRSVTFLLEKENEDSDEFNEWYPEKREEMRESTLFEAMKEARNFAVHEGHPQITVVHISGDQTSASIYGFGGSDVLMDDTFEEDLSSEDITIKGISELTAHLGDDYRSESLEEICEEYLNQLDDLLSEWEAVSSA